MDLKRFRDGVRALVRALGVLDAASTPCGLELGVREAYALAALSAAEQAGSPSSQTALQEWLGVDKSNVTRLVQQLVGEGLAEQRVGSEDARVRTLHLTGKGRRMSRRLEEQSTARFAAVLARLPEADHEQIVRALELLRGALDAEQRAQREQEAES